MSEKTGWEMEEPGWHIHPIFGGVCRESDGWYIYPMNYDSDTGIGPYKTLTIAKEKLQERSHDRKQKETQKR